MRKTHVVGAFVAAIAASCAFARWEHDKVDVVDIEPLEAIVAGWKAATPSAPRKVLLFSECFGYNHHAGRCYGDWTFRRAGEVSGAWSVVQVKDVKKLADKEYLSGFDAICFCNSTCVSEKLAPGLTDALSAFVKGGKGIALIHSGLDAFKDSDVLLSMFGGYFRGHPWHSGGKWKIFNERPANPINASFRTNGASFFKVDEIYQFPAFFDRSSCTVLLSVDLSDPATKAAEQWWEGRFGPGATRPDHDYAVSWTKSVGKGRVFYTTFGHDKSAFLDAERLYHMFAGLQYALGDLPAKKPAPRADEPVLRTDWAGGPWRERMNKSAKDLKGQSLDFAFFGDSITMGWTYPAAYRYPGGKEVWDRHFGKMKTANFGMSGDRTEHLIWRIEKDGQADGWTAKVIFVMIGINNSRSDPDAPAAGAARIVSSLKSRHPESKIVLFGALPARSREAWVREYNERLSKIAGGSVVFADIGGRFLKDGKLIDAGLFNDGLHPNPKGYEVFAEEMDRLLGAR